MSASRAAAFDAITLQLLAALEEYEVATEAMIAAWPDMERYAAASGLVEKIRMFCASLPEARVQWAELLIAHAELVHHLWRAQYGPKAPLQDQIAPLLAQHARALQALRRRCALSSAPATGGCGRAGS
ncbi:MAG: hypothetical protein ACJ8GO_02205 [Ramlibacter sp.]